MKADMTRDPGRGKCIPLAEIPTYLKAYGIRGAVWDIDGTLIDSMPIWEDLGARYLTSVGKVPEPGLGKILFPMTIAESVRYLKESYGLPQTEAEIRAGLSRITDHFYRFEVPLKMGAAALLGALSDAGVPMALATIGDVELEEAALGRLGVRKYFQGMYACEDYRTTKKEAKIYKVCAEKLGTRPGETLVVEDIFQAVHAAKAGGFVPAAAADPASRADREKIRAEADFWFEDFSEMEVLR